MIIDVGGRDKSIYNYVELCMQLYYIVLSLREGVARTISETTPVNLSNCLCHASFI